jgi:hypothetical protein
MNTTDDYQWRYRSPAPSLYEVFAGMLPLETRVRRWHRRRQWMVMAFLIGLGGSAVTLHGESVAASENTPFVHAECLVQQTVSAVADLPIFIWSSG